MWAKLVGSAVLKCNWSLVWKVILFQTNIYGEIKALISLTHIKKFHEIIKNLRAEKEI